MPARKQKAPRRTHPGETGDRAERRAQRDLAGLSARGVVGLTKAQMAAALQVSVRTLNGMMRRGEISYYKIGSKLVRFRLEDALKRMGETVLVGGGN